jgi:hypothetical protein
MYTDPIVEEVHEIRTQISEENNGDLELIYRQAIECQRRFAMNQTTSQNDDETPKKRAA